MSETNKIHDWLKQDVMKNEIALLRCQMNDINDQLNSNQKLLNVLTGTVIFLMLLLAFLVVAS